MTARPTLPRTSGAEDAPPPAGTPATWRGLPPDVPPRPSGLGWALVALRGGAVVTVLLLGVLLLLPLRAAEALAAGRRRPLSGPWVQGVCRLCLLALGIRWQRRGARMRHPGAMVANHSSWLDILVLNAAAPVFFVSKAEVAGWPGINILTRVTDTHFVTRDPKLARAQAAEFVQRTALGHRLLFFPEGTSTDGRRVLPFKPTLFQAFLDPALPPGLAIQPVTVRYTPPWGREPRFYGWWGDMDLGPHLLAVLGQWRQGGVTVTLHPPIPVAGHDRKSLAAAAEAAVRGGFPELPPPG
ncbi:lysophospholipid acyltransferase family protein [Paracoccus alkenifer]|uniref:Lyso-ornithine lipid acyltransferase n=1 Tax=Paracoccus alkenifer TaxID=65735 RepID=A0A1H6K313_9RHOB|nr:lysophospholipid acyltransferase family protein [Paracoccus alkenifer]SEH66691.1 lyso-ornithine lipid acyltransferase [Paracoccus alkenifer]